jgi:predicted nucleotide-binding protein
MKMENLTGYWTGEYAGTNKGGLSLRLEHVADRVYGRARLYEHELGTYEYNIQGQVVPETSDARLFMTPGALSDDILLGNIEVLARLRGDGALIGEWWSDLPTEGTFVAQRSPLDLELTAATGSSIFIVHGHDEATKEKVARFIEKLGLEAVILHERSSRGMTIIEKFEAAASRAKFAIVLFTPDDIASPLAAPKRKAPRARQNVVLEFGYFAAKLGRKNVAVLRKGDVEMPSDLFGIVYTLVDDSGAWMLTLAKELRAAGFAVDLNRVAEF